MSESRILVVSGFTVTTEWCKEIPLTAKERELIADGNLDELGLFLAYDIDNQVSEEVEDCE